MVPSFHYDTTFALPFVFLLQILVDLDRMEFIFDLHLVDHFLHPLSMNFKVRAGVEMAVIDAAANSTETPLQKLFGGASDSITTDITVKTLP